MLRITLLSVLIIFIMSCNKVEDDCPCCGIVPCPITYHENIHGQIYADCSSTPSVGAKVIMNAQWTFEDEVFILNDTLITDANGMFEYTYTATLDIADDIFVTMTLLSDTSYTFIDAPHDGDTYVEYTLGDSVNLTVNLIADNPYTNQDTLWYQLQDIGQENFIVGPFSNITLENLHISRKQLFNTSENVSCTLNYGIGYHEFKFPTFQSNLSGSITDIHTPCDPDDQITIILE